MGAGAGDDGGAAGVSGEAGDEDGGKGESCVPADERFTKCRICGDRFEMYYDNDEEEWMYANACYVEIHGGGVDGSGEGEGETGLDGDTEGYGLDKLGEGNEATRQIIVHKLCLDVSGLRDREVIRWNDLIPGTPTPKKQSLSSEGESSPDLGLAATDVTWSAPLMAKTEAITTNGAIDTADRHQEWDSAELSSGDKPTHYPPPLGGGPPLKRVKAEELPEVGTKDMGLPFEEDRDGDEGGDVGNSIAPMSDV
ncbi:unnamed protein product [Choristocarpus tenellus]